MGQTGGFMVLNARMIGILRELMAAKTALTSEYLANVIQVTSRTIRNDMKELDALLTENGAAIRAVRGTGYELIIHDHELFRTLLKEIFQTDSPKSKGIPTLPEERADYLIKRLLLSEGYVKLEDLAEELYISKSTIQNDLRTVKKRLKAYGLELEKRPNYGLKLKGDEMKWRFCMSEYLFNRKETERSLIQDGVPLLPEEEMKVIQTITLEQIKEEEITLSDIGLNNLIIHIAIACKRIQSGNYVSWYKEELKDIIKQKEFEVATNILKKIGERLKIKFPFAEIAYVAIHLLGTKITVDPALCETEVQTFIDPDIYALTMEILETIENKLRLGIQHDKELVVGISLHLKPAINRYRFRMNIRNPMLETIKSNYTIAFEAAILAGMVLKEKMGIEIDENEMGYLALHIAAAMERSRMNDQRKKRCMIVCASGVGSARLLYYKLRSRFGSRLEILGTTEYYKLDQIPMQSLDFLISTVPIPHPLPIPVIEVNTILEGMDLEKIERAIFENAGRILEYAREELVFLQQTFKSREEVLHFLGDQLQQAGLVDETFLASVFEREALSPTSFGNLVAIPHPIVPQTETTFWAVCTLQKPIEWGDKRVQFVCLLSVKKNSREDLQKMYDLLGKVVNDGQMVQQLLKCKTYREFVDVLFKQS
jgi:lichenan operon transcriptional antiterminator